MSYADIIHDLEGDKGREWFILRREAYEQAAKADAEIAALTERLRAVEAERDYYRASFNAELDGAMAIRREYGAQEHETFGMFIDRTFAQLSALRAELQRKDAALRKAEQALFDHVAIEGDQASFALRAVRAALQPKEPPCQTA